MIIFWNILFTKQREFAWNINRQVFTSPSLQLIPFFFFQNSWQKCFKMTLEIPIIQMEYNVFGRCADDVTVIWRRRRKEKQTKYSPNNMIMTFSLEYSRISPSQARILSKLVFLVTSYSSNRAEFVKNKKTGKMIVFFLIQIN